MAPATSSASIAHSAELLVWEKVRLLMIDTDQHTHRSTHSCVRHTCEHQETRGSKDICCVVIPASIDVNLALDLNGGPSEGVVFLHWVERIVEREKHARDHGQHN